MRPIKEIAQEALDVQDASNLLAVFNGAVKALTELQNLNVPVRHREAIMVLWSSKIASLTHSDADDVFGEAFDAVTSLAGEGRKK